jgi:hypothetical protein
MTKVNAGPQAGEGTVWFDYFIVTNPTTNVSSTSSTTSTLISTGSTSSTMNSSSATPTGKKSNVEGIMGGVIGGVVLFPILLLCLWRYRRRVTNSGQVAQLKPSIDHDPSSRESAFFLFYQGFHKLHFLTAVASANFPISPFDTNSANVDRFPLPYRAIGSINNSRAPAWQQNSSLHHAANSSSRGKVSVHPSEFVESLTGSSSTGRPPSASASQHLLRPPLEVRLEFTNTTPADNLLTRSRPMFTRAPQVTGEGTSLVCLQCAKKSIGSCSLSSEIPECNAGNSQLYYEGFNTLCGSKCVSFYHGIDS